MSSPATLALVSALVGLFLGGAAAGSGLARALAPDSWIAETVSFFALPVAFAVGLQAWYGLALVSLIPRVLRLLSSSHPLPARVRKARPAQLPGSFLFLPLSSGAGTVAGVVVGLLSSTYPVWFIVLVYWLVGTVHGLLAWRLARGGILVPPEST
jgi:hypothetical protein